ncbi:uncharacterized protein LOC142320119 [Lycorma delicatula]|uniref:uncharacterized protein LOC142320119 n=1 Tax=Lycorma delicatula TaxID=130591 RepID=UPI003F51430D
MFSFCKNVGLILAKYSAMNGGSVSSSVTSSRLAPYRTISVSNFLFTERPADLLTDQERTAYSRLFKEMDKDKDGIISKEELKKGLQDFIGYEATDSELNESMEVLDKDKDGKVDIKDFLDHMQARKKETRLEAIRFTFEMWDSNADGFIERGDLKNMLKAVGEEPSDDKVDKILNASDHDKDGKLSFSEFKDIFKDKHF